MILLTWSTTLTWDGKKGGRQFDILREWADSKDGRDLYEQFSRDLQYPQNIEELALKMTAMMNYRRLLPDELDNSEDPIHGSDLFDLDYHFKGHLLGNSGRLAERMVFALLRVLSCSRSLYEDLIVFVETALDREPLPLHVFAGFSDEYLHQRIQNQSHEIVMEKLALIKMPKLEGY